MPMRPAAALFCLAALAACSPDQVVDAVLTRTAATVVRPVVNTSLTGAAADGVTDCITANATNGELDLLSRDVATYAGTSTVALIRAIAARPGTRACFQSRGLPAPQL